MNKSAPDELVTEMGFGDFVEALRNELRSTTERLYQSVEEAKKTHKSVHAFLLDSVELNVGCKFDQTIATKIKGKVDVETGGLLKVVLGKGSLSVEPEAGQSRGEERTAQLRIVMKPGLMWYDDHDESWRWLQVFAKRE